MCKDVYVFAEQRDGNLQKVGIELIGEARKLADDLGQNVVAVLLGNQIKDKASELIAHGADKVVVVDDEMLAEYVTEPYAKAMMEIIQSHNPEIVLYGSNIDRTRSCTKSFCKNPHRINSRLYKT